MSSRLHRRAMVTAAAVAALAAAAPAVAATPTVVTSPADASLVSDTYALLSGVVNPNGIPTKYHFEYGTTTAYGSSTPDTSAGNGKAEVPVDYSLDELQPSTTYHYRLVASGDTAAGSEYAGVGQIVGEDQTFTTAPSLSVSFVSKKIAVAGRKATITLKAIGPAGDAAKGKLVLLAKVKSGRKTRTKTIGRKRFSVKVGATKPFKVTLSRSARKALARRGTLKALATAGDTTAKLTLKG